ncbi:hypothetical protein QTO34_018411 [Cnephaeus nilssonii]|uniref:BCD1 alpha/beta domain-containing protein n=1 Tax=Cnephaeus nilssonii TaxID=3371016 RepID=A0AA40LPZ5_CNENI|nr:hypothetical protein QTO34_018411 [Eptesicus nilssonii]
MDFAAENEATSGGGLQRGAEGARPPLESGGGEAGNGLPGMEETADGGEGRAQSAEEMRVCPTAVKLENMNWSETEGGVLDGRWIKQEVEDGPEVKEEKPDPLEVKQEVEGSSVVKEEKVDGPEIKEEKVKVKEEVMDWLEVKEERKENLEIKQEEMVFAQNIKEEVMDEIISYLIISICTIVTSKYKSASSFLFSLPCVKKHKAELTCNGVRDKTAYVSLQQFTEMDLLSDYRFLEDVARTADHISRDALLKRSLSNKHMCFMKNRARRQGINLKLLPNGFTKRKENSTFFDKK